jgi:multidrug resistance efflux pump
MKELRKYAYSLFMLLALAVLLLLAKKYNDASNTVMAEVQAQKFAISYHRPVRIKKIYVLSGQEVKKGDKILEVERPDLLLDAERKQSSLDQLYAKMKSLDANRGSRVSIQKIERDQKLLRLDSESKQLQLLLDNRDRTNDRLVKLNLVSDSMALADPEFLVWKVDRLSQEIKNTHLHYELVSSEVNLKYQFDVAQINAEIIILKKEMQLLELEHVDLIKYALADGTVGNVYREVEEIIPPYTTIVSLYEKNPTVIRAFMNEKNEFLIALGHKVNIESANRSYRIEGVVKEIGNRIIEYPRRLNANKDFPIWGREVFIEIPKESKFLNGEKVFVLEKN